MNKLFPLCILFSLFLLACSNAGRQKEEAVIRDSLLQPNDSLIPDDYAEDGDYSVAYAVIVDTSRDYFLLDREMFSIQKSVPFGIDTMNRYFDKKKKGIVLPENDEDEMYAGEYYPRRINGISYSIEYLSDFDTLLAFQKTMALVAAVTDTEHEADSVLTALKPVKSESYKKVCRLFTGCMH